MVFEAGNETREKVGSDFGAEQKWRAERKESGFCSYRCFWESEKLMCEKISSKRAKFFFVHVRHFKAVFFIYFGKEVWLWFWFNFRLVLVVVWRFLEIHMNFMISRRFLMYFADFRAIFCVFFDDYFVLLAQMSIKETPSTWEDLWKQLVTVLWVRIIFLLRNMTKKLRKLEIFFLIFCSFSFFFLFLAKFRCLLWLGYCFESIWIPYWLKAIFLCIYMFFEILKNLVTFSSFSVKVVFKSFFHNLALSIFFKIHISGFLSTSCFDEVILAEIVFSGSQFITKFDQIFYHILAD